MKNNILFVLSQVCYALRYLATGCIFSLIKDTQGGCATSTIKRAVLPFCQVPAFEGKEYLFPKGKYPCSLENSCYTVLRDIYRKLETFSLSRFHTMSNSFSPIYHLKNHDFTKMSTCSFIKKSSIPKMVVFIKCCFSFSGSRAARGGHSFCREAQGHPMRGVHR